MEFRSLVAALAVCAAGVPLAVQASPGTTVRVCVNGFETKRPVAGVTVRVASATATTGPDGCVSLAAVPGGLQRIDVMRAGFATFTSALTVRSDLASVEVRLARPTTEESSWLARVNRDRTAGGVAPLAFDEIALEAARTHTGQMAQGRYLSHQDTDGAKPYQRFAQLGGIGLNEENVADGFATVDAAEDGFLAEPAHRRALLDAGHTAVGLAVARDASGRAYYDQEFVTRGALYDPADLLAHKRGDTVTLRVISLASSALRAGLAVENAPQPTAPKTEGYTFGAAPTGIVRDTAVAGTAQRDLTFRVDRSGLNELFVYNGTAIGAVAIVTIP